jgi:uncharacterized protein (DUF697 family)
MSKIKNINIAEEQIEKCDAIIHSFSLPAWGLGTGFRASIPEEVIAPVQISMISELGKAFNQEVSTEVAKAILDEVTASFARKSVLQVILGWIHYVGNAVNGAVVRNKTEAIGWQVADGFSKDEYREIHQDFKIDDANIVEKNMLNESNKYRMVVKIRKNSEREGFIGFIKFWRPKYIREFEKVLIADNS